jgi:hypothetical protein
MTEIEQLNNLLGRELGRTLYGEPKYKWQFSDELFWPAYATGKFVDARTPAGLVVMQKEYRQDRMSQKLDHQWVVTKWCSPESLDRWQQNFPSAPYPGKGYYIHTNASLDPWQAPTQDDTEHFIRCIREQTSMSYGQRLRDMEAADDREELAVENETMDFARDCVPAFVNEAPGKRGGSVSMPSTSREIKI